MRLLGHIEDVEDRDLTDADDTIGTGALPQGIVLRLIPRAGHERRFALIQRLVETVVACVHLIVACTKSVVACLEGGRYVSVLVTCLFVIRRLSPLCLID